VGHEPAGTSQGERYTMNETINIVRCRQPDEFDDKLKVSPKRHAASGCTGDGEGGRSFPCREMAAVREKPLADGFATSAISS
jgi:hypothetical protein